MPGGAPKEDGLHAIYLDKLDHGWMRAEMADVWMGFDRVRVEDGIERPASPA